MGRIEKFKEYEKEFTELHSKMPGYDAVDRELDKMLQEAHHAKPKEVAYDKWIFRVPLYILTAKILHLAV